MIRSIIIKNYCLKDFILAETKALFHIPMTLVLAFLAIFAVDVAAFTAFNGRIAHTKQWSSSFPVKSTQEDVENDQNANYEELLEDLKKNADKIPLEDDPGFVNLEDIEEDPAKVHTISQSMKLKLETT